MAVPTTQGMTAEARSLVENLTEEATWDDVMDDVSFRIRLTERLAESDAGRVTTQEQIKRRYGLIA